MTRYARTEGVLVEPLGRIWAAFSPLTGETALLNDESAAILEVLDSGPADTAQICIALSSDSGVDCGALVPLVTASWQSLVDAGLVKALPEPVTSVE